MVSKQQSKEMLDFFVENIRASGQTAKPNKKRIISSIGKDTTYINVENDGIIFLLDMYYPQKKISGRLTPTLPIIYKFANHYGKSDISTIFFKDSKTYFRNAAEDKSWKNFRLSLKHYDNGGHHYRIVEGLQPMQRIIFTRPEEKLVLSKNRSIPFIQYFQPDSPRLDEMLISFRFKPVELDYSHETKSEKRNGFKPTNRISDKLNLWDKKFEKSGSLYLQNGFLRKYNP